jgi:hypothetical protein
MSNLSDVVGEANLFGGGNYSFVPDRFCTPKSAIYFNKGYLQVPSGVYFSGDFTFTGWIYLKSYQFCSRIIDFGGNFFFSMDCGTPKMKVNNAFLTTSGINLNQWYFVSFVLRNTTGYIYANGSQIGSGTISIPKNVTRYNNFFGKSIHSSALYADAVYDEFKIIQRSLSSTEIINEFIINSNSSNLGNIMNYCSYNYWPMSNLSDVVGEANLFGGFNYSFVPDRFCTPNSAIYFNSGYLQVPTGVYFLGDFTFTAWIYLKSYQLWTTLFDFGNGSPNDNVYLGMYNQTNETNTMYASVYNFFTYKAIQTKSIIDLNKWYFLSFVLSKTKGYVYVNGNEISNGTLFVPNNLNRTSNYFGKSNYDNISYADAIYDEIKIYQIALSSSQIMNEYQISSNLTNIINICSTTTTTTQTTSYFNVNISLLFNYNYFDQITKNSNYIEETIFYVTYLANQFLNYVS